VTTFVERGWDKAELSTDPQAVQGHLVFEMDAEKGCHEMENQERCHEMHVAHSDEKRSCDRKGSQDETTISGDTEVQEGKIDWDEEKTREEKLFSEEEKGREDKPNSKRDERSDKDHHPAKSEEDP
jgi:hypothetical protein